VTKDKELNKFCAMGGVSSLQESQWGIKRGGNGDGRKVKIMTGLFIWWRGKNI